MGNVEGFPVALYAPEIRGGDIDAECVKASYPGLLLLFEKHVLNDDSNITVG